MFDLTKLIYNTQAHLCAKRSVQLITLQRLPITRDLSPSKDSDKAAFWWTSIKEKP